MNIEHILNNISPLPQDACDKLKKLITEVQLRKNTLLMDAEKMTQNCYFIKQGIVRAFANLSDIEITFWFGQEGDTIISMKHYVLNQKSYEHIELLEDCILYELNIEALQQLYQTDIHIANWGRRFAEKELIKTEERLISRQFRTATDRYHDLLKDSPDLIRRVPLKHIASYLGITQVSLSRIRADIR